MLSQIADGVFTASQPLRFAGLQVGARMNVIALGGGNLLIHSPIRPSDELRAAVEKLGRPSILLAPNKYHHMWFGEWMKLYPEAQAWAAPGLHKKRSDLRFTGIVEAGTHFGPDVEQLHWEGNPTLHEIVLHHKPSRTMITCDLVHNLGPERPPVTRFFFKLLGGYGGVKTNVADRFMTRDRAAARVSLERVLDWKFERLVMAHGTPVLGNGRDAFAAAYSWLK
jgi:hypothetical protein